MDLGAAIDTRIAAGADVAETLAAFDIPEREAQIMELARHGERSWVEITAHEATATGARHQTDVCVNLINSEVGRILVHPPTPTTRRGRRESMFAPAEPFAVAVALRDLTARLPTRGSPRTSTSNSPTKANLRCLTTPTARPPSSPTIRCTSRSFRPPPTSRPTARRHAAPRRLISPIPRPPQGWESPIPHQGLPAATTTPSTQRGGPPGAAAAGRDRHDHPRSSTSSRPLSPARRWRGARRSAPRPNPQSCSREIPQRDAHPQMYRPTLPPRPRRHPTTTEIISFFTDAPAAPVERVVPADSGGEELSPADPQATVRREPTVSAPIAMRPHPRRRTPAAGRDGVELSRKCLGRGQSGPSAGGTPHRVTGDPRGAGRGQQGRLRQRQGGRKTTMTVAVGSDPGPCARRSGDRRGCQHRPRPRPRFVRTADPRPTSNSSPRWPTPSKRPAGPATASATVAATPSPRVHRRTPPTSRALSSQNDPRSNYTLNSQGLRRDHEGAGESLQPGATGLRQPRSPARCSPPSPTTSTAGGGRRPEQTGKSTEPKHSGVAVLPRFRLVCSTP